MSLMLTEFATSEVKRNRWSDGGPPVFEDTAFEAKRSKKSDFAPKNRNKPWDVSRFRNNVIGYFSLFQ
jgi:hypothetical protein